MRPAINGYKHKFARGEEARTRLVRVHDVTEELVIVSKDGSIRTRVLCGLI